MSFPLPNTGLCTWDYPPAKGGLGRAMFAVQEALLAAGTTASVYTPIRRRGGHLAFSLCGQRGIARWIEQENIELLLVPLGPGGVFVRHIPSSCQLVSLVYHTYHQQSRLVPGQWWKRVFVPFERRQLRRSRAVFCYSDDTKHALIHDYGVPADKVHLLPQIVDLSPWTPATPPPKIPQQCICCARLEKRKGVEVLLKAWQWVQQELPDAKLVLVGSGILASKVDRFIQQHQLSVQRYPSLDEQELIFLVQTSSVSCSPAYLEGFGLSTVEAMAAGTLVVATDCDGLCQLVGEGDERGFLARVGNEKDLAALLIATLQHSDHGAERQAKAQQWTANAFNVSQASKALHSALKALY